MTFEINSGAILAGAAAGATVMQFIAPAASAFVLFTIFRRRRRKKRKARPVDYVIGALLFVGFGAFFVFLSTLR